jgi:hypothetical protein
MGRARASEAYAARGGRTLESPRPGPEGPAEPGPPPAEEPEPLSPADPESDEEPAAPPAAYGLIARWGAPLGLTGAVDGVLRGVTGG